MSNNNVVSLASYRSYEAPPPRTYRPKIGTWGNLYRPDGTAVGHGYVSSHDREPAYFIVRIDGLAHVAHWADFRPDGEAA